MAQNRGTHHYHFYGRRSQRGQVGLTSLVAPSRGGPMCAYTATADEEKGYNIAGPVFARSIAVVTAKIEDRPVRVYEDPNGQHTLGIHPARRLELV